MPIYAGAINRDHVHLLIGIPPNISVSRAVQHLKGKSSYKLLSEFTSLKKRYWGQHLWGRGYWVASSGNVTDEVWQKYIEDQKPEVPDDNFKVVWTQGRPKADEHPAWAVSPKPPALAGGAIHCGTNPISRSKRLADAVPVAGIESKPSSQ
jgi:hypothetical protein